MNLRRFFLFLLCCSVLFVSINAQTKNTKYLLYIDRYKDLAVEQMYKYHIPASITLAQGLFESGAGEGDLARKSNNHFGIKCGGNWFGPTTTHDDDARGECFRVYRSVRESYEDHSQFLRTRGRYSFLFNLPETDYQGWAYGLKKAGYATNPLYAQRLIDLINLYELYQYDGRGGKKHKTREEIKEEKVLEKYQYQSFIHPIQFTNGLIFIVARNGDSLNLIAREFSVKKKKLLKYNDLYEGYQLKEGDIIYIQKKKKIASRAYFRKPHVIKNGESMYSIAQFYGIRLKNLYKMNRMRPDDEMPRVGATLRIR